MYKYYSVPRILLRRCCSCPPGVLQPLQKYKYCTEARPDVNRRIYDLSTYQFHYTVEEKSTIIDVLNKASEDDLLHFGITKGIAKKILKSRLRIGCFQDVSQLMDIDGFGLKSVEGICTKVLKDLPPYTADQAIGQHVELFHKKRLVKPRVQQHVIENAETILAIDMTIGAISWTLLDRHGMVLDLDTTELLSKAERTDAPKLYDKIVDLVRILPSADVYVWEERANYGYLQKAPLSSIMVAIKLAQMRGILTALLDKREEGQEKGCCLYYLKDLLVSKLFCLKVGGERVSGSNLADELMTCKSVLDWLPPLELEAGLKQKYFSIDKLQRRSISTSLFIGLAFQQTIFENNIAAHRLLNERE